MRSSASLDPHALPESDTTLNLSRRVLRLGVVPLQPYLGHSKLETTQVYAESTTEMIEESYWRAPLGEYYNGRTSFSFVWGGAGAPAHRERRRTGMQGYQVNTTRLRGKRANIRTYWQNQDGKRIYNAELIAENWEKGQVVLYAGMESNEPAAVETANQVFRSIEFPLPTPERQP